MAYTQSPPITSDEVELLLKEAPVARFCSFNEDETIHAVPIWFKYADGQIIIGTPEASRKARNVKRNKNVTVLVDVEGSTTQGVIIYGRAELDYKDVMSWGVSLFEKYMTKDKAESAMQGLFKISTWVKIVVTPKRIASFDYAKDITYRTALQG